MISYSGTIRTQKFNTDEHSLNVDILPEENSKMFDSGHHYEI